MESAAILEILKELTQDLQSGKRNRAETVSELHHRIEANLVYDMDEKDPQREFITQVFVSLDNLTDQDFPPTMAEMKYFADCFEGKRQFNLAEVREFELIPMAPEEKPEKEFRFKARPFTKAKSGLKKPRQSQVPSKINRIKPAKLDGARPSRKDKPV